MGPWLPTKKAAKAAGAKHFFTGKECIRGHISPRLSSNGVCMDCYTERSNDQNKARREDKEWKDKQNAKARARYAADPSKSKEQHKKWIAANSNQRREYSREYMRMRRAADPSLNEAVRVRMQEKRQEPGYLEAERERERDRYAENPDKFREKSKRYAKENPEVAATHARNRRARMREAEGHHSPEDVEGILNRQKYKCASCGTNIRKDYEMDHMVALSRGGSNWPANLQGLCPTCNRQKNNLDPIVFAQRKGRLL